MKRRTVIALMLATTALTWGLILPGFAQDKTKPEASKPEPVISVARAVVGTGVENLEPTGVAETFPATTEKVFCFIEVTDIPTSMEVTFVWTYGDKEVHTFSLPVDAGPRWRTYAEKRVSGMKGDWKVEIKGPDGKVLKDVKFKVE